MTHHKSCHSCILSCPCPCQVKKLEQQYRTAKEAVESEVQGMAAHVEALAAEVAQLRGANSATVAASEERVRALQAEFEDLQR